MRIFFYTMLAQGILNEQIAWRTGVDDSDITVPVKDYGRDYPQGRAKVLKHVTFEELKSGQITLNGKKVQTVPVSSYVMALEIADTLKAWIQKGDFLLTEPQAPLG